MEHVHFMSKQAPPVLMQLCQSCMSTRPATTPTRKKSQGGHRGCVHAPSLCALSCPTLRPYGLQPPRLLCPWDSPAKSTGVGLLCPPPGDLPNPGIEPRSPALPTLQAGSFIPSFLQNLHPVLYNGCNQLTFPPTTQKASLFSKPSPTFTICRFFGEGLSDWCEVIPHCIFDLHFSNNE